MQKMKAGSLPDLVKMAGDLISLLCRKADTPRKRSNECVEVHHENQS